MKSYSGKYSPFVQKAMVHPFVQEVRKLKLPQGSVLMGSVALRFYVENPRSMSDIDILASSPAWNILCRRFKDYLEVEGQMARRIHIPMQVEGTALSVEIFNTWPYLNTDMVIKEAIYMGESITVACPGSLLYFKYFAMREVGAHEKHAADYSVLLNSLLEYGP